MAINRKCLKKLHSFGLPMMIELVDNNKNVIAEATINNDGSIDCSTNNKKYDCPSLFRGDFLGSNLSTYKFLRPKGQIKTLSELGVSPVG